MALPTEVLDPAILLITAYCATTTPAPDWSDAETWSAFTKVDAANRLSHNVAVAAADATEFA
jgi:hypothetical protein